MTPLLKLHSLLLNMRSLRLWNSQWRACSSPRTSAYESDEIEVAHFSLMNHFGYLKGGYANRPDSMDNQPFEILADYIRRARKAAPDPSRP